MSEKEKPKIIIQGAEGLNIVVTAATHTVEDEKGRILYKKKVK